VAHVEPDSSEGPRSPSSFSPAPGLYDDAPEKSQPLDFGATAAKAEESKPSWHAEESFEIDESGRRMS
jgi:hypothetical protein